MKEVLIAKPRGFCAGVDRALAIVEQALSKYGAPVYLKHSPVHNETVVEDLCRRGAILVQSIQEVPPGSHVVFSAHGSPPEDYQDAAHRNLHVIDAVCPLVTRVHNEARKYAREGRPVIIVGHSGHVEVKGTLGQAFEAQLGVHVVDPRHPDLDLDYAMSPYGVHQLDQDKVVVLTQTTLSQEDVAPAVEAVKRRFADVVVKNDICYATTNRQQAVKYLASVCDLVLVVGSDESSNSLRLAEVARRENCTAYLIPKAQAIPWFIVRSAQKVGVTSGASTPERLVEEVVDSLEREGGFTRREVEVLEEDVHFKSLEGL